MYKYLFDEEVRNKRSGLSGVRAKTGKRGYTGVIRFPSDLLRGKEKRLYRGTGKVVSYNMYDTIMPYAQFRILSDEEQKKTLEEYRIRFSNKEIQKFWDMSTYEYYNKTVKRLGIKTEERQSRKGIKKEVAAKVAIKENKEIPKEEIKETIEEPKEETNLISPVIQELNEVIETLNRQAKPVKLDGLHITMNGQYEAKDIIKRLEKIALILDDEESNFQIEFTIKELG